MLRENCLNQRAAPFHQQLLQGRQQLLFHAKGTKIRQHIHVGYNRPSRCGQIGPNEAYGLQETGRPDGQGGIFLNRLPKRRAKTGWDEQLEQFDMFLRKPMQAIHAAHSQDVVSSGFAIRRKVTATGRFKSNVTATVKTLLKFH